MYRAELFWSNLPAEMAEWQLPGPANTGRYLSARILQALRRQKMCAHEPAKSTPEYQNDVERITGSVWALSLTAGSVR